MSAPLLVDDIVEQILLRLPPDEPACLVRASLISKPVRSLLTGAAFRRRYREFHRRSILLGFLQIGSEPYHSRFVSTSIFRPTEPDRLNRLVVDCRHGRALFVTTNLEIEGTVDLIVWDPMTNDERWVPQPSPSPERYINYTAAVLCADVGCDHCGCQEGPFRVAFVSSDRRNRVTVACLYSSETGTWSEFTSVHHPLVRAVTKLPSVYVGDGLYFHTTSNHIIEYKLGTPCLLVFGAPVMFHGKLMTVEGGGLGFASVDDAILTLWSKESEGWAKHRVIDLRTLLPDDALLASQLGWRVRAIYNPNASVIGFAEGTAVIFVRTFAGVYLVELKSRRVMKVHDNTAKVFPYMSLHIPAMEAASMDEGPI